jgi:hypothetical protein
LLARHTARSHALIGPSRAVDSPGRLLTDDEGTRLGVGTYRNVQLSTVAAQDKLCVMGLAVTDARHGRARFCGGGAFLALASILSALALAGCGGQQRANPAEAEVRTLIASVVADGRTHNFARICKNDMSGLIKQLDYVVGADCATDLATEWEEGVQLTSVQPSTRIAIKGNNATIFDGQAPDRARRVQGRWLLAEVPRNKRLAVADEARRTLESLNEGFRVRFHSEINLETGRLELTRAASTETACKKLLSPGSPASELRPHLFDCLSEGLCLTTTSTRKLCGVEALEYCGFVRAATKRRGTSLKGSGTGSAEVRQRSSTCRRALATKLAALRAEIGPYLLQAERNLRTSEREVRAIQKERHDEEEEALRNYKQMKEQEEEEHRESG